MMLKHALALAIEPGLTLLPPRMDSPAAKAMLLAIGLQESEWQHRRQIVGPARGYYQFERDGGVIGVMTHRITSYHAMETARALDYRFDANVIYYALECDAVLASIFARLLLWSLPQPLPSAGEVTEAYSQYLEAWRPGRPRPSDWPSNFERAWQAVAA